MVKIHFLQKVLKKWSSFRKKNKKKFSITGGGGGGGAGPYMEFPIIDFIFFLKPSLREDFKKKSVKRMTLCKKGGVSEKNQILNV